MKNKQVIIISAITAVFTAAIIVTTRIAYYIGYCNAFDKYVDASECKPMRKLKIREFIK